VWKYVVSLAVVVHCNPPCHGTLLSSQYGGGTGTVTTSYATSGLQPTGFNWADSSPVIGGETFELTFDAGDPNVVSAQIWCRAATWAALKGSQPVPLDTLSCELSVVLPADAGMPISHDFDVTSGTVTATSTLDKNGNGTLVLTIDIPSTTFPAHADDAGTQGTIAVDVTGMQGTATFGDYGQCGSGSGSGCFAGL